jgi:hypothetical protein
VVEVAAERRVVAVGDLVRLGEHRRPAFHVEEAHGSAELEAQFLRVVRESAVDYHRVAIDENYEQVLVKFLVGRTRARGVR